MQLLEFTKANRLSLARLAAEWGINKATLSRNARGESRSYPTFPTLVRAWVLSGGKVGLADWIELYRPKLEAEGIVPPPSNPTGSTGK